jgi:hypothetical protein
LVAASGLRAAAQGLPTPLPPANPTPIGYCPPERLAAGAPSTYQVLNVFLPLGPAPSNGWPVVVGTGYGGASSSPPFATLSSTGGSKPYWDLVAAGIAVVHYGVPGLGGNNRGLWYPPGHPSGRSESYKPAHDNPEKSAVWALQWVKVQTQFPFDLARVALRGSSGGAVLAVRTAMGPERARASGSAQVRASTRVAAVLAIQPPTSAWALEQGPELTIPFPKHLEQAAFPGVAATQLSQVDPELQKDYSLMRECFASAEARANNEQQPLCIVYGDPVLQVNSAPATFALDATGFPVLYDLIKQPTQHDSWFGYVFWKRLIELSNASAAFHAANSLFAMRDIYALPAPLNYHTRLYAGTVLALRATRIGHDWLVGRLNGPQALVVSPLPPVVDPSRTAAGASSPPPALVPLEARTTTSGRFRLEGAPGASAWILMSRPTEPRATPLGALWVDPTALCATPLRGASDASGAHEFELEDVLENVEMLHLQVLVLDRHAGPRLSAALAVRRP